MGREDESDRRRTNRRYIPQIYPTSNGTPQRAFDQGSVACASDRSDSSTCIGSKCGAALCVDSQRGEMVLTPFDYYEIFIIEHVKWVSTRLRAMCVPRRRVVSCRGCVTGAQILLSSTRCKHVTLSALYASGHRPSRRPDKRWRKTPKVFSMISLDI